MYPYLINDFRYVVCVRNRKSSLSHGDTLPLQSYLKYFSKCELSLVLLTHFKTVRLHPYSSPQFHNCYSVTYLYKRKRKNTKAKIVLLLYQFTGNLPCCSQRNTTHSVSIVFVTTKTTTVRTRTQIVKITFNSTCELFKYLLF